jgi:anoctamin-10
LLGYVAYPTKMSWLAGQEKHGHDESDNLGVDWVLQYEFGDIGKILRETKSRIGYP